MANVEQKLAIIVSGQGVKSSYGAGALLALAEQYQVTEPFLMICGSGSAGTGAYFVAGQPDRLRHLWVDMVSSRRVLSRRRFWKIIDIDYIIDEVCKRQHPLDARKVLQAKTRFLMPALNTKTGHIDYFDNHQGMDVFECLRAAKAMPIAYKWDPRIAVGGSLYCDSLLSARAQTHIGKAVECGATKILIIHNMPSGKLRMDNLAFKFWMRLQPFRKSYYQAERDVAAYHVPPSIKVLVIRPSSKLWLTTLSNRKADIQQAFDQGYDETSANQELAAFLR